MKTKSQHYLNLLLLTCFFLLFGAVAAYAQVPDTASDWTGPQSTFVIHGRSAQYSLDAFWYTVWVSGFLTVVVGGIFAYVLVRFRAKPGQEFAVPEQSHGSHMLEIGLIIASCFLLVVIAVPNAKALFAIDQIPEAERPNALKIEAIGHQWWWEFKYPELGITTANELHIPTNRPVDVDIKSVDVLHAFWIPQLAGKMDAAPGQVNKLWFDADTPGKYYGQCTEFCGASHGQMRFLVFAHEQAEFDAWVNAEKKDAVEPETVQEINGKQIFMNGCNSCHAVQGTDAMGVVGPNLTHFGSRTTLGAGMFENTEEHLKNWIKYPQKMKPGNLMILEQANMKLSDKDVDDLVAYLKKLK